MFLFTMLFNLLMLPFTLLRMAFGLLGISTHILKAFLIFPLKIFARHTVLCLIVIAAVILHLALKKDPHAVDSLKPAMVPQEKQLKASRQPKNAPPLIQAVKKYEDGDSAFATDTYAIMTEPERAYYSAVFYKIMGATPDGRADSWAYYNIHGAITPTRTFRNNSGVTCRAFTEMLKVHTVQQTISGTACDNGEGTWCKLKPNATAACNLGHTPGALDGISNAVKRLF